MGQLTIDTKGPLKEASRDWALSIHLTMAASITGALPVRICFLSPSLAAMTVCVLFESTTQGSLRNTKFCCISLASPLSEALRRLSFLLRENDFLFPIMISMCTLHQPQVASWKQTGYRKARYHGSKVKKKNITTVVFIVFSECCHV